MRLMVSVDDGHEKDWQVFEMLKKYGLEKHAVFYIAPYNNIPLLSRRQIREISQASEVGGHTLNHSVLTKLKKDAQIREILDGNAVLEEITGKRMEKFAVCRGWYNEEVEQSVRECGMEWMRTMKQGVSELEEIPFVLPISVHFHPYHYRAWREMLDKALASENGYFHVTCHGWELQKFNLWKEYETLLSELSKVK